jgi:hypothetical protein
MSAHRALNGRCPVPWVDITPMNEAALKQMEAKYGPAPQHVKDQVEKMKGLFS